MSANDYYTKEEVEELIRNARRETAERIVDEIKTSAMIAAAEADIDESNRSWWYGHGYGTEEAVRIARKAVK